MKFLARLVPVLWLVFGILTSCASQRPASGALRIVRAPQGSGKVHSIMVASNRASTADQGTYYTGARGKELQFHKFAISVPHKHAPGKIERPKRGAPDPHQHFVNTSETPLASPNAFLQEMQRQLRSSKSREVAIFVHGYNTHFAEALFLSAQIANDTAFKGVPLLFTWPSQGKLLGYMYDRDSVLAARDALHQTISLAAKSGARRVVIFAHSMGSMLTMEAVRQAKLAGDPTFGGKLRAVLLASPDISIDVFKSQVRGIGPTPQLAVLVSKDDKALYVSKRLSGNVERVGNFSDDSTLADLGVVVADLTKVKSTDRLCHDKFAQFPGILTEIASHLETHKPTLHPKENVTASTLLLGGRNAAEVLITTPTRVLSELLGGFAN